MSIQSYRTLAKRLNYAHTNLQFWEMITKCL